MLENSTTNAQPKGVQEDERSLLIDYYVQKVSGRLRQLRSPSDSDKKRWIWELLQNAKDCISNSAELSSVDIEVIAEDDYVIFKHNGEPFTPKALNSLIWQKSGEKRGNSESTGRFGTGFLTTHTLSQNVFLESILTDADGLKWGVKVNLCREGERDEDLRKGIEKTLESRNYYPNPTNYWTTFKYQLKTHTNKESAIAGITSLKNNMFFTLAFAEKINSVKLVTKQVTLLVTKSSEVILDDLKIIRFSVSENNIQRSVSVIFSSLTEYNEQLSKKYKQERSLRYSIAVQISEDTKEILPILTDTPYLYCVFPLVGTENFYFPVVVNSPDFEPVAERDRLLLAGNEFDEEKQEITNEGINKTILLGALKLYSGILTYLSNDGWSKIHLLAKGAKKLPSQDRDFDKDWYKDKIQTEIRRLVLDTRIVDTNNGFKKLNEIYFPEADKKESLQKIWDFTNDISPDKLPKLELIDEWSKLIWDECHSQTIKELTKQVSEFQNINTLNKEVDWLNKLVKFVVETDESYLNEFALIPNVKGEFRKLDYEGLSKDSGLPNSAFVLLLAFGVDWEDIIVDKEIDSLKIPINKGFKEFSDEINSQIKQKSKDNDSTLINSIFTLLSAIPTINTNISDNFIEKRETIWRFSKDIFNNNQSDIFEADDLDDSLWEKCDEWVINEMIKKVSAQKSVNGLAELNDNLDINWLNDFIGFVSSFIKNDLLNQKCYILLPDQYGDFSLKSALSKDDSLPEELKDKIFVELGIDLKKELLDKRIDKFKLDKILSLSEVATRINDLIGSDKEVDVINKAVYRLISLLPNDQSLFQEELWNNARIMYGNDVLPLPIKLTNSHPTLWTKINNILIIKITSDVESFKPIEIGGEYKSSVRLLADHLSSMSTEHRSSWTDFAIIWLSEWIDFLYKNELPIGKIIPNQNDKFCSADIYNDDEIHDELKSILFHLNKDEDFKNFLVHGGVSFRPVHSKNTKDIAQKINDLLKDDYKSQRSDEQFKKAVKLLVVDWFNNPTYSSDLHKEFGYGKTDKINYELFKWSYDHRFELETNVLSSIDERKYLYTLNNYIREHEIPFDEVKVVTKLEYDGLKAEVVKLRSEAQSSEMVSLILKLNLTEEKIKLLVEIEEKTKEFEGMSNYLEKSAQALIHSTGVRGEEIVFEYLTNKFGGKRVRWVSRSDKNDEGIEEHRYDFEVLSEDLVNVMWYIDAKATLTGESQSDKIPILIRKGTWDFIRGNEIGKKNIFLARVFGVKDANADQVQLLKIQYYNSATNDLA